MDKIIISFCFKIVIHVKQVEIKKYFKNENKNKKLRKMIKKIKN